MSGAGRYRNLWEQYYKGVRPPPPQPCSCRMVLPPRLPRTRPRAGAPSLAASGADAQAIIFVIDSSDKLRMCAPYSTGRGCVRLSA